MIEVRKLERPKLIFYNGKTHYIPKVGLSQYGPFSRDKINEIVLNVISIRQNQRRDFRKKYKRFYLESFLRRLSYTLKNLFKVHYVRIDSSIEIDYKSTLEFENYLEEVTPFVNDIRNTKDNRPHVILQFLPFRSTINDSIYNHLRLVSLTRKQGKENDIIRAIPVQSITLERARQAYRNPAILENLALGIYVKAGGIPWQIKNGVSKLFKDALYVGYDISRKDDIESVGSIVVYDNSGQIVYYKDFTIHSKYRKDIIPTEEFYKFIIHLIEDARNEKYEVDTIIIHRDGGNIPEEELQALRRMNNKTGINYVALAFSKSSFFPLFEVNNGNIDVAESGLYFTVGTQFVGDQRYKTILVQTIGRELPHSEMTPNLLKVRFFEASKEILKKYSYDKLIEDFARETFYLSRLNWSTKFGFAKLPVTVHYAHKVSQLLSLGLQLGNIDKRKLWML